MDERTVRTDLTAIEATADPVDPASVVGDDLSRTLANANTRAEISSVVELAARRLPPDRARVLLEVCKRLKRKPKVSHEDPERRSLDDVWSRAIANSPFNLDNLSGDSRGSKRGMELTAADESSDDPEPPE